MAEAIIFSTERFFDLVKLEFEFNLDWVGDKLLEDLLIREERRVDLLRLVLDCFLKEVFSLLRLVLDCFLKEVFSWRERWDFKDVLEALMESV